MRSLPHEKNSNSFLFKLLLDLVDHADAMVHSRLKPCLKCNVLVKGMEVFFRWHWRPNALPLIPLVKCFLAVHVFVDLWVRCVLRFAASLS